jgi:hypothetical protein
MGEIAEAMLSGLLDCETGEYLDGDEPGYPRTWRDLEPEYPSNQKRTTRGVKCPVCKKMCASAQGVLDHGYAKGHWS